MPEPTPVIYQAPSDISPVHGSGELFADAHEAPPFALGQPAGFSAATSAALTAAGFSDPSADTASTGVSKTSQAPTPWDLEWVQGDTTDFQWIFTDVFWLGEDPAEDTPLFGNPVESVVLRALTSNVATLTIDAPHSYQVGYSVTISGVGAPFDGVHTLTAVTSTTMSYAVEAANVASGAADGTAQITNMPVWEERFWAAQVRNPYLYSTLRADAWVPVNGWQYSWWRGHSTVATFNVTAELVTIPATATTPVSWGTLVTANLAHEDSKKVLPGSWYRWDLQTAKVLSELDDDIELDIRTHLRGRCRVITEWTF